MTDVYSFLWHNEPTFCHGHCAVCDALRAHNEKLEKVAEAARVIDDVMPTTYISNSEGAMKVWVVVKDAEAMRAALDELEAGDA